MTKYFCDICGKEITNTPYSGYKLKKKEYDWHESRWLKLIVHDKCWVNMCNYIKHSQESQTSKESE